MSRSSDISLRPVARSRAAQARRREREKRMAATLAVRSLHAALVGKSRAQTAADSAREELAEAERILDARKKNLAHKRKAAGLDADARDIAASTTAVDIATEVVVDRRRDLAARIADAASAARVLADAERAHAAAAAEDEPPVAKAPAKKKGAV